MDNNPQTNQPAGPTPVTTNTPGAANAPKPAGKILPKDQSKKNRRFIIGCLTAFGCSIFLFFGVLFAFVGFGSSDSQIFNFLGSSPEEVVSVLITLTSLIFLFLIFISFIVVILGIFKITAAKKDDKEAKRKGMMMTFGSVAALVLFILVWLVVYFFLAAKRPVTVRSRIITEPEKTINLTAPVTVKFDASRLPINKNRYEILSYAWNFGDGSEARGNPQTHTFEEIGNFKTRLALVVKEKTTGKEASEDFSHDVTIANIQANVVIEAKPEKGGAPLTVALNGGKSSAPNGEITAFAWDLDGNGEFDDSENAEATANFTKIGTYKIALRVTDSTGQFSIAEKNIEVTPPDTPTAVIAVEETEGDELMENQSYVFIAASSTSPSGAIEKYLWSFGDGETAATRTATHAFEKSGTYEVTLQVTDAIGKKGETARRFTVKAPALPPLPLIKTTPAAEKGTIKGQAPFDLLLDASGSTDPNNDIVEYSWDFDGDGKRDGTSAVTSHQFTAAGTYKVSLTLTDSTEKTATAEVIVAVEPAGLRANLKAEPLAGVTPLTVAFDASGSGYPGGSIASYEWNFGDGNAPRIDGAKVTYQYTAIGTFTAKVTAIASDNKRATTETIINVRPVPVRACFETNISNGKAPLTVEFDPACSTGTVIKYRWSFGTAGKSTDRKPSFTFSEAGEYETELEVADNQNVIDRFKKTITVTQ